MQTAQPEMCECGHHRKLAVAHARPPTHLRLHVDRLIKRRCSLLPSRHENWVGRLALNCLLDRLSNDLVGLCKRGSACDRFAEMNWR